MDFFSRAALVPLAPTLFQPYFATHSVNRYRYEMHNTTDAKDDDDTLQMREIAENLFDINAGLSQRNLRHF